MPHIELTLRQSTPRTNEVTAWYLPGDSTTGWINEVAGWPVDHATVRIVAIRSQNELDLAGALVIPQQTDFKPGGNCLPYFRLENNLYVPVGTELFPELSKSEVNDLFEKEYIYVWVPGRGLTAVEPEQMDFFYKLLVPPPVSRSSWCDAVPGIAFINRITAILPNEDQSAEDIILDGQDDIGERSNEITELPKAPREPNAGIAGAIKRTAIMGIAMPILGFANLAAAIGSLLPEVTASQSQDQANARNSTNRSFIDGLNHFANQLLQKVSKSLEELRNKEINRLMNMLENDPDQGLKFAIPMTANSHRGQRPAQSNELAMRDTNFNLGRLGGGSPADVWDMPWEYQ